jgi:hypothetical protein
MVALLALAILAPTEVRLPAGALCPDAKFFAGDFGGGSAVVYGDGKDCWLTDEGSKTRVRVNSEPGTVHAGGERGPKVAGTRQMVVAWQGDYRQGPKVWFTRMIDGKFEPQKNLVQGETPGLDHVAIADAGNNVVVCWLDGRGGQDPESPVTSTIWFTLSMDGGKTFGPNRQIKADQKIRACACCSFAVAFTGTDLRIVYRSGINNVRDIWMIEGNPVMDRWKARPVSNSGWVYKGCPMDGPRFSGDSIVYTIYGTCYLQTMGKPATVLGQGKYPNVCQTANGLMTTYQRDGKVYWSQGASSGVVDAGDARVGLSPSLSGKPLLIH